MKKHLLLFFFILSILQVNAQTYHNEWIEYDQQYLKFPIAKNGIYRISYDVLNSAMNDIGVPLATVDPRNFQLINKGVEQYIHIAGEADGVFNAADYIEFYGEKNDGTFDSLMFEFPEYQLHQYESIITDTAMYFLTWNDLITNLRLEVVNNDLSDTPAPLLYHDYNTRIVYGAGYGSGNFNAGDPFNDILSSDLTDGEGYATGKYNLSNFNVTVNTPDFYTGTSFIPRLKTALIANGDGEHHFLIKWNGEIIKDTTFFNYRVGRYEFNIEDVLASNTITFSSGPVSTDYQRYSYININYPRSFSCNNESALRTSLLQVVGATTYLECTNFNEKFTTPLLYDLSNHKRIEAVVEADISKFHLDYNATEAELYFSSQDATDLFSVTKLTPATFVNYGAVANQGNYMIISNKVLFEDVDGTNWVDAYRDYRASIAGGSHDAIIVDIDVLYDMFSYGLKKHPLAIRNFVLYAVDNFITTPEYLFLIGKSYSYDVTRANGTPEYAANLVPTFGNPGSDNMLVTRSGDFVPVVAVGRISAKTANDVRIYYDKVIEFEAQQADHLQTIANKAWMKNVLHFAGGASEFEQTLFNSFLNQYKNIIEDTLYGGNVIPFNKLNADPIFYSESAYVDSLINNGVSLITFFGHSSTGSFDYNIGSPNEFENEGKYFAVYGNGCNTAAIHGDAYTLGEQYIFAENKAAIAFLAASNFSIAANLHTYATLFYRELANNSYNLPMGVAMRAVADTLWPTDNPFDRMTIQHNTLQGDPAIRLNTHDKPDYAIESPYVHFEPDVVSAGTDSIYMHLIVTNLGAAIDSSYFVEVKRTKFGGETSTFFERFPATRFRDTLIIPFATDGLEGAGLNTFSIHLDKENEIGEIDEFNNILTTSLFVISDDAMPIYPVEFTIMNHVPEYFAASTTDAFAPVKQYIFEADTTTLFNSPLRKTTMVTSAGGVIKWENPPLTYVPNVVYYWRVTPDTSDESEAMWRSSSFLYLPGEITGWNQSHYYQYLENDYSNINLEPTREFTFVPDVKTYEVATGIYPTTHWTEVTSYADGELLAIGSCASTGFVVLVADANSAELWQTSEVGATNLGPYGDVYCSADAYERVIQFYTNTPANREKLYNFMMNDLPDSTHFICYSNNYPDFYAWLDDTLIYGHSLFDAFNALGATDINALSVFDYDRSYIFYAQKGNTDSKVEIIGDPEGHKIEATFVINGNWNKGNIETPLIGPAEEWDKAQWSFYANDLPGVDTNSISVIGVKFNGLEVVLKTGLQSGDTSITFADADLYPYIKLRLETKDDTLRTPAQFNFWRVIYDPVPEAAVNPNLHFAFNNDTLQQGAPGSLELAITNVSDYNMDSLLINFGIFDANNLYREIPYSRQDSLLSDESMIATIQFNTNQIPIGRCTLVAEVNPKNDQEEQFHYNNFAYLPIQVIGDAKDPLLDITFDGVHILDGDIVSAKPQIIINLKDENPYLALADTSLLKITMQYPNYSFHDYYYDGVTTKFYPADPSNLSENNSARVEINPIFSMDGTYELHVQGMDNTGNTAGDIDYTISFEVINKAMVSNVMNYPNPFTSQTRFVFTLTGSEVPEYFKIQIMTVTGKVVREIMRSELGELHIGNNITEFAWDGTDQFGDPLANGLYVYRVVTRLNGESIEKYDTGTDQYFNSGFGKMYLAR